MSELRFYFRENGFWLTKVIFYVVANFRHVPKEVWLVVNLNTPDKVVPSVLSAVDC